MHKRIMSKVNISKFKDMPTSISWDDLHKENNTEYAYRNFIKVVNCCFNDCFPIGSSTRKSQDFNKPLFTSTLRKKTKCTENMSQIPLLLSIVFINSIEKKVLSFYEVCKKRNILVINLGLVQMLLKPHGK